MKSPQAQADSTSEDSDSIEEALAFGKFPSQGSHLNSIGSCSKLAKLFKLSQEKMSVYEFDSRVGLNCSQILATFCCIMDEENKRFLISLGDITIDKFTKSTFMNLANFAEEKGAKSMIFVQNRDHC